MSNYMDFWFVDKRNRKKTILMYLLIFIVLYFFISAMTYMFVHGTYRPMENYNIEKSDIEIIVEDARTTNMNGYIKGKVDNNTGGFVRDRYLKFELISENNTIMGNKYIDLSGLVEDETKKFELKYELENVSNFNASIVGKDQIKDVNESDITKLK